MALKQKTPQNRRRAGSRTSRHLLEVSVRTRTVSRKRATFAWKLVTTLLVIGALGFAAYRGGKLAIERFFLENPDYRLSNIDLQLDGAMTREDLLRVSGVAEGTNLFTLNLAEVERRLRENPCVDSVEIERRFPNYLAIRLKKRAPIAWISSEDAASDFFDPSSAILIAADGMLMPTPPNLTGSPVHLPAIFGAHIEEMKPGNRMTDPQVLAALDLSATVDRDAESLFTIRAMDLRKSYRIEVITDRNIRVYFGLKDFESQVARLNGLLKLCADSGREVETVNLLVQRNTPVTFVRPPAPVVAEVIPPVAAKPKTQTPKRAVKNR